MFVVSVCFFSTFLPFASFLLFAMFFSSFSKNRPFEGPLVAEMGLTARVQTAFPNPCSRGARTWLWAPRRSFRTVRSTSASFRPSWPVPAFSPASLPWSYPPCSSPSEISFARSALIDFPKDRLVQACEVEGSNRAAKPYDAQGRGQLLDDRRLASQECGEAKAADAVSY